MVANFSTITLQTRKSTQMSRLYLTMPKYLRTIDISSANVSSPQPSGNVESGRIDTLESPVLSLNDRLIERGVMIPTHQAERSSRRLATIRYVRG